MTIKDNEEKQNSVNQIPKGVGVSPKLFMAIIIVLVVIFIFVFSMVFSYRGNKHNATPKNTNMLVTQENSISPENKVAQLNENDNRYGVLVSRKGERTNIPIEGKGRDELSQVAQSGYDSSSSKDNNDFRQAAHSNISVVNNYQGASQQGQETAMSNSNQPQSGMSNNPNSYISDGLNASRTQEDYQRLNMQKEKKAFLTSSQKKDNKFYLDSKLEKPISPFEVKAGTIIPAILLTGIDSDLPGQITAKVSRNVYDTVTGNYLLIPQGTTVIGKYDSQIAYGQTRVLIAWSRLIFPNGDSFDLEGQPGVDLVGMAGLHDLVDNHYVRIFGSALMFSAFGALGQLSQPQQATDVLTTQQIIYAAIGQELSRTGAQLVEKNINIQPTIKIRPGTNFNILLTRDMGLPAPYEEGNKNYGFG